MKIDRPRTRVIHLRKVRDDIALYGRLLTGRLSQLLPRVAEPDRPKWEATLGELLGLGARGYAGRTCAALAAAALLL